jgi:hypothetical protein
LKSRFRSSVVVLCLKRSLPASNSVGDVGPSDTLAVFLMRKPNWLPPYTVPRSHVHPRSAPFTPTAPEASMMSEWMIGRKPFGYRLRSVRSSLGRRQKPVASPVRVPTPPNE